MVVHVIDFSRVVTSESSKLNPLGRKLRDHIWIELERAQNDSNVTSIVLTGGQQAGNFSAGADLTEFAGALNLLSQGGDTHNGSNNKTLIDVVNAVEACPKPVVACIQGACLGGGLELALACHYRVAAAVNGKSTTTKLGLPEVHVGVIPGAGGTQRLPRLIGLQSALRMILTGTPVPDARKALQLKLVDAVVDSNDYNELLDTAQKWALWGEVLPLEPRRLSNRDIPEPPPVAHGVLHVASLGLPAQGSSGLRAALEACRASTFNDFARGMRRESELFLETLASPEGQARRHAFFAVRQAQKPRVVHTNSDDTNGALKNHPLLQKDVSQIRTAVIGAGTMGGGIALVLLRAGYKVTLVDVAQAALDEGVAQIRGTVQSWVQRKKMTAAAAQQLLAARLSSTTNLHDLRDCQLVVEAVVENLKIKQNIFRTLDQVTRSDCVLLSNTSTLDMDRIMKVVATAARPAAGWHFFSPAHVMQLVEIVVARRTAPETVRLLQALTKRIGKIGVVVGNCDGFCGNRLLRPYSAEMVLVVVEHDNTIQDVDRAMLDFGMALGPYQMADLAGNDIGYNIRRERGWVRDNSNDSNNAPPPENRPARYTELGDDMVTQLGRLGQKAGKGWYDYDPAIGKGRKALPSPEMDRFVQRYRVPGSHRKLSDEEIVERLLYPLVNEGFKCLEEGIARSPGDIDVVYLYGYGWPAWRGGPMYWADHGVGLDVLLARLQELHRQFPDTDHFVPSQLLVECVRMQVTVQEYYETTQKQSNQQARSRL